MTVPASENASKRARAEEAGTWCMRLADGELSTEDKASFDAWLFHPGNRDAFDQAVVTWQEMESAADSTELLPLRIEALESLRAAKRFRAIRFLFHPWLRAAAVAALVALMVGGAALWSLYMPDIYETGVGERRVAILSDGSRISLDAATRVEVRFSKGRRDLRLAHGRAKFDVAKDPLRPFAVAAADRLVVATGTEFSVELLQREVHVVLYEGHVSVLDTSAGASKAEPVPIKGAGAKSAADGMLVPGRELVTPTDKSFADVALSDPGRSLSWEAGQLVFTDEPLSSAVERVNRYAKDKLEIADPKAGGILVSGVFSAGDTQAFAEGVTAVFPVELIHQGNHATFVARK